MNKFWKNINSVFLISILLLSLVPLALADTTVVLNGGESTTFEGKTVTFVRGGESSVIVQVDGTSKVISLGATSTINGLKITLIKIYDEDDTENDVATIKISSDSDSTSPSPTNNSQSSTNYDANNDGVVDEDDFYFCGEFLQAGTYNDRCDFNDDGVINSIDLSILSAVIGDDNLMPDLIVDDISFSPSSPEENEDVYVTVTIKNQGDSTAQDFWIGLYEFYGAEQVTSSDADKATTTKTISGYTLGAGQSMKKTFGPYKFNSGSHTMMAWVDMFNNVAESNENNNVRYETVAIGEASSGDIIFKDDFSGPPTQWTMVLNTVASTTEEPGVLRLYYLGEGEHNMLFVNKDPGTNDYAVTAKLAVFPKPGGDYTSSDTRAVSVVARYQDSGNFYYAGINERNNAFFIEKYVNGEHQYLNYAYNKGPAAVEQNQWYDVKFELNGNTLRLYVDGELIKEAVDTSISSGKFGIRSTEAFSKVDDFIVYTLDDTPYVPPSGDFAVSIDTDKTVYGLGDLARISVRVKGQNVDVDQTKLSVKVEGNDQSFGITMTRGVCVVSSADTASDYSGGSSYCTWEGYFDTSLIPSEEEEMTFIASARANLDGQTKEDKTKFEVNSNIVVPENLVDIEITPTYRSVLPGDIVTYTVTIKDNHPINKCGDAALPDKKCSNTYNYNLVVSGLPFKDTLPHKITLAAGEKQTYEMTVYTKEALEDAVGVEVSEIETEIEEIETSDDEIDETETTDDDEIDDSVSQAHSNGGRSAVASVPQPTAHADTVTETAVIVAPSNGGANGGGSGKSKLVSAKKKPVVSNNYYGKTYSFTVKANLQGQSNVRDSAYASLFVGKETESEVPTIPQFPETAGTEYVVELHKGWNLVSLPGRFLKFDSQGCTNNRKLLGFVWLKDEQRYVSLKEAENILGNDFKQYMSENAFWVYSFESCKLSISVTKYSSYEDIELAEGWNLVPVTEDMVGQSLSSIGDCDYLKLYFWNADDQEWSSLSENYVFYNTDLTKGFVAKVNDACTLGTAVILPPEMPED